MNRGKYQKQTLENQKLFLDGLAIKLNIKSPSDWGSVRIRAVQDHHGSTIIERFGGSLQRALKTVYSGKVRIRNSNQRH